MVDCSRNAVMTVAAVKEFIDEMKEIGYNLLLLYTEDTYEIPEEPLFGYLRGKYTQAELKEIDDYAFSRGIEVVPCIQTLAHLNQIFAWDRFKDIWDTDAILLVGEEETYAFIEKMFASVAACFRSKIVHVGMDEAHTLGLGKYLKKNGLRSRTEILMDHLVKVCEIAKKYGFTLNMWGDMFYGAINDGEYYDRKTSLEDLPDWVREKLPENLHITYWDYYHETAAEYAEYIRGHQELNRPVWFAGGIWRWAGINPSNAISLRRGAEAVKACKANGVDDVFFCAWGDDGCEVPFEAAVPALFACGKYAAGIYAEEEIKREFEAFYGQKLEDMLLLDFDLPYVKKRSPKRFSFQNGVKAMLYGDPFLGKYDYSVEGDGSECEEFARHAEKLAAAMERSAPRFKRIFEIYWRLARILSKKYDLSYRIRTAYQKGDGKALAVAAEDCDFLCKELPLYLSAVEEVWLKRNKANGLETLQIRLGGVIQRVRFCRDRLIAYLSGPIAEIAELDEKIVPHKKTEEASKLPPHIYKYKDLPTVGLL